MNVQPYLSFEGRAQEAMDFYTSAIGAKVDAVLHFKDAPPEMQAQMSPESKNKVMHAAFHIGDTQVMATDGRCTGKAAFSGISLTINAGSDAEAEKLFNALAQGGQVGMPMSETFFAHRFGMVADKFGVGWMVLHPKEHG
jgi:PhnB protein